MKGDIHYQIIAEFYGDKKAERSGEPYIKHIDQGLAILDYLGTSLVTKQAYCLHPIVQVPNNLRMFYSDSQLMASVEPRALLLAMEYRNKANAYLCRPKTDGYTVGDLPVMVLPEVTDMLVADKVQNYSDFQRHHEETHPRNVQLDNYFRTWITHLGLSITDYISMKKACCNY